MMFGLQHRLLKIRSLWFTEILDICPECGIGLGYAFMSRQKPIVDLMIVIQLTNAAVYLGNNVMYWV